MSTVWKVVDDTDSRIKFSGRWNFTSGDTKQKDYEASLNELSRSGDVFNNTVHGTTINGTTFTFRFNGTSLAVVYGTLTSDIEVLHSDPNLDNSFREVETSCFLDGKSALGFGTGLSPSSSLNNREMCRVDQANYKGTLFSGEHELLFNVSNLFSSRFYLDYIVYESLPDAAVDGDILQMGNGQASIPSSKDPHLTFGPGWGTNTNEAPFTNEPGSSVTVKFNGTAIQLYGELDGNSSNSATYQLDKGNSKAFGLFPRGVTNNGDSGTSTNQMLFDLSNLSPEEHTVTVTHNGSTTGMPLTIDYFLVTSLTLEQQASLSSPSIPIPSDQSSRPTPKGKVIGGVIGGFTALALTVLLIFFGAKRRRQLKNTMNVIPTVFVSPSALEFNPYSSDLLSQSLNRKTDSKFGTREQDLSNSTRTDQDGELDAMRLGNLKLQQRLAVLQRPVLDQLNSEQLPVIHTDSGWRMRQEEMAEVPPNYTEA